MQFGDNIGRMLLNLKSPISIYLVQLYTFFLIPGNLDQQQVLNSGTLLSKYSNLQSTEGIDSHHSVFYLSVAWFIYAFEKIPQSQ